MDNRKWQANAKVSAPSVPASPSAGFPGNGGISDPATTPGEWWYHQIGEELRSVITAAGLNPTHNLVNQLLAALTAGWGMAKNLTLIGYITLPGGLIIQWTSAATPVSGTFVWTFPLAFPNGVLLTMANHYGTSSIDVVTFDPTGTSKTAITITASPAGAFSFRALAIGW